MSSLTKMNFKSGVKSLVAANRQQIVAVNEKRDHGLKLWQLGLLLGIPSALLAFYLIYRRQNLNKSNKKNKNVDKKTEVSKDVKKTDEKKTSNDSNLSPEERINKIHETIKGQSIEVIISKYI